MAGQPQKTAVSFRVLLSASRYPSAPCLNGNSLEIQSWIPLFFQLPKFGNFRTGIQQRCWCFFHYLHVLRGIRSLLRSSSSVLDEIVSSLHASLTALREIVCLLRSSSSALREIVSSLRASSTALREIVCLLHTSSTALREIECLLRAS